MTASSFPTMLRVMDRLTLVDQAATQEAEEQRLIKQVQSLCEEQGLRVTPAQIIQAVKEDQTAIQPIIPACVTDERTWSLEKRREIYGWDRPVDQADWEHQYTQSKRGMKGFLRRLFAPSGLWGLAGVVLSYSIPLLWYALPDPPHGPTHHPVMASLVILSWLGVPMLLGWGRDVLNDVQRLDPYIPSLREQRELAKNPEIRAHIRRCLSSGVPQFLEGDRYSKVSELKSKSDERKRLEQAKENQTESRLATFHATFGSTLKS